MDLFVMHSKQKDECDITQHLQDGYKNTLKDMNIDKNHDSDIISREQKQSDYC